MKFNQNHEIVVLVDMALVCTPQTKTAHGGGRASLKLMLYAVHLLDLYLAIVPSQQLEILCTLVISLLKNFHDQSICSYNLWLLLSLLGERGQFHEKVYSEGVDD